MSRAILSKDTSQTSQTSHFLSLKSLTLRGQIEDPNEKFYIWSTKAEKVPGTNGIDLESGTSHDNFVCALKYGFIALVSEPTESNLIVEIDSSDGLVEWFSLLNDNKKEGYKFSLKFDNQQKIESFHFSFSNPWALPFGSATKDLEFSFGDDSKQIPESGISLDGTTLYCGLDESLLKPIEPTIRAVITYSGLASMLSYIPAIILDTEVTLDASTAKDNRNALWFRPANHFETTFRTQFELTTLENLQNELNIIPDLIIKDANIVCKRVLGAMDTSTAQVPINAGQIIFYTTVLVGSEKSEMKAAILWLQTSIKIILEPTLESLASMLSWIAGFTGASLDVHQILEDSGAFKKDAIKLRRITIGLALGDAAYPATEVSDFRVDIEVPATFGQDHDSVQTVVFLITYSWTATIGGLGSLIGQLWTGFDVTKTTSPTYEPWTELKPITEDPADRIKLLKIIPGGETVDNLPNYIPTDITEAYISVSDKNFAIRATVKASSGAEPGDLPQPYLGLLRLAFSYTWSPASSFTLQFKILAGLRPSVASKHKDPATIQGQLDYDSKAKTWGLKGSINGLYASTLAEFFDTSSAQHVMPLIESISLDKLELEYSYKKSNVAVTSVGSSFKINGTLLIASLTLELDFVYEDTWKFSAKLHPTDAEATIGDVIKSILNDDQLDIPAFLADMPFSSKSGTLNIKVAKEKAKAKSNTAVAESFLFTAEVNVGPIEVVFVQYHGADWLDTLPSKRLLKVAINPIGKLDLDIPLIGHIDQPLDEVSYTWVQDETALDKKTPGLSRKEITNINASLADSLVFNDKFKEQKPEDVLVSAGSHFFIIANKPTGGKICVLDYCFKKSAKKSLDARENEEEDSGTGAEAPLKKKTGPLTFSNVGLKWASGKLVIKFDATMDLGPLNFSLLGFSINVALKRIDQPPEIWPGLEGLSALYDKDPLIIGGIIRHGVQEDLEYFAGGLIIGFVPWQFTAAGFYGNAIGPTGNKFNSVFIFMKLDGPLLTLEFAEISGVTGGFGYKSDVKMPAIDKVVEFPFVASKSVPGNDALKALEDLTKPGGWFSPMDDTYWAAVGLKVSAFEMISLDAVAMVQFGTSIKLSIVAVATGDIPSLKAKAKFSHIELGILVMVDFDTGVFKAEAQLSPSSYVLHPDCHLTGGFGLYYWFEAPHCDKSKTGDFVFTLGGYHQAFKVPDGYPNPPRLGISWSLGSSLSFSGQAYFAITPKACMAGGRLHASFSSGPIEAWFDAFADFLINYKPFHFIATGGISIGVRVNIDILFIHTHISVEIGADLTLWGPPVAGSVHVSLWVVSFTISFGDSEDEGDPLSLIDFYDLVLQLGDTPSLELQSASVSQEPFKPPKNQGHLFLVQSGMLNESEIPEREQNEIWTVRGGSFSFVVACKIAIKSATLTDVTEKTLDSPYDVYGKPTKLTQALTSNLAVTIEQDPTSLDMEEEEEGWRMERHIKQVPTALWQKYSSSTDPTGGNNHISDLLNADSEGTPQMMGVLFIAPPPIIAADPFPAFNIEDASLVSLQAEKPFPDFKDAHPDWIPTKPAPGEKQWKDVHDYWEKPVMGLPAQEDFVTMFKSAFAWGDKISKWKMPERLGKKFDDLYIAAPLLTT
ncbi:hypothetical protein NHQ30_003464 [Ciborinia camelliae]|nr:hypothetical protein NHQ30_003464 [Ciborinia camelliae]